MKVLVTGGAGYIGSHTSWRLQEQGHNVVVVDNLYSGHRWALPQEATFYELNVVETSRLVEVLAHERVDAVIHFAAHIEVEESTRLPLKYYQNNVGGLLSVLTAMERTGVDKLIFSSTAAVYGNPQGGPLVETAPLMPINPYGETKRVGEQVIAALAASSSLRYVILRYFNVAGARTDLRLGQATPRATHLIKVAAEAASDKRDKISIFGSDYDTTDGTCIRDYIHVDDLAHAHILALQHLNADGTSDVFNCGYGQGFSVKQVIETMKAVSKTDFSVEMTSRRAGDPESLVANADKIKGKLGWQPRFNDLELICRTAYEWEKRLPSSR